MQDLLLLSKDTPIAKIVNGAVEPIVPARLPLFLRNTVIYRRGWSQGPWTDTAPTPAC